MDPDNLTGKFVQFLKLGNDAIMLDVPMESLRDEELDRARWFSNELGADRADAPLGSFYLDYLHEPRGIRSAATTAVGVFRDIFQILDDKTLETRFG